MRWAAELSIILGLLSIAPIASAQSCHEGTVGEREIVWRSTIDRPSTVPIPRTLTIDRITGGRIENGLIVGHDVHIVAHQPIGDRLTPPLADGPQRITLEGPDRVTFAPHALERRVGYHASRTMTERAVRMLDEDCGRSRGVRIYVEPSSYLDLEGEIGRAEDHRRPFLFLGGALFLVLTAAGVALYRRFARAAEIEDAEAAIEERFRAIE